jgi:hypothetical protein
MLWDYRFEIGVVGHQQFGGEGHVGLKAHAEKLQLHGKPGAASH